MSANFSSFSSDRAVSGCDRASPVAIFPLCSCVVGLPRGIYMYPKRVVRQRHHFDYPSPCDFLWVIVLLTPFYYCPDFSLCRSGRWLG